MLLSLGSEIEMLCPFRPAVSWISSRAVRSHYRAQNCPSLYQAVSWHLFAVEVLATSATHSPSLSDVTFFLSTWMLDYCQAGADPIILPRLNAGLRMNQCETLLAEPWTPSLVISFQPVTHNTCFAGTYALRTCHYHSRFPSCSDST